MTKYKIILPKSLTVRLKTTDNKNIKLDNVLCHLNIYMDKGGYYTFSFIPTNSAGTVFLTKDQILANTELKHYYKDSFPLDKKPVKFEFKVIGNDFITSFIKSVDSYLSIPIENSVNELRSRGFSEQQIEKVTPQIIQKAEEDKIFNSRLKQNKNHLLNYDEEKSKIVDYWTEENDYSYDLILQS